MRSSGSAGQMRRAVSGKGRSNYGACDFGVHLWTLAHLVRRLWRRFGARRWHGLRGTRVGLAGPPRQVRCANPRRSHCHPRPCPRRKSCGSVDRRVPPGRSAARHDYSPLIWRAGLPGRLPRTFKRYPANRELPIAIFSERFEFFCRPPGWLQLERFVVLKHPRHAVCRFS